MKSGRERGGERKRGREKVQIGGNEMVVPRKIKNWSLFESQLNSIQCDSILGPKNENAGNLNKKTPSAN